MVLQKHHAVLIDSWLAQIVAWRAGGNLFSRFLGAMFFFPMLIKDVYVLSRKNMIEEIRCS